MTHELMLRVHHIALLLVLCCTNISSLNGASSDENRLVFPGKSTFRGPLEKKRSLPGHIPWIPGGGSSDVVSERPIEEIIPDSITPTITPHQKETYLQADIADSNNTNITSDETIATDTINNTIQEETLQNYTFGASKPGDGSESDIDGLPTRFLTMQKGNRHAAKTAFAHTLAWREEHDVDTVLSRPHPKFDQCKAVLPHYFPGRDIHNNPIFVQRPGKIDLKIAHKNNVTMDELLMHYVYVIEYCWNILEPKTTPHDGVMTSVLDLTGVGWNILHDAEMLGFVRRVVGMMSENYPQRSHKTLIINSPRWFNSLYTLFKPLLRESTKKKIEIYCRGKRQERALREILGEDSVPKELLDDGYKKKSTDIRFVNNVKFMKQAAGPHSMLEEELRDFCMKRLEETGMEMETIVN